MKQAQAKRVYNLTDTRLSETATIALTKGLAFTPTPKESVATNLIIAVEQAATFLGADTEAALRIKSHAINVINKYTTPQSNISRTEREAIRELKRDSNVTIFPADKGRATVLIPTAHYHDALIQDMTTYTKLPL
jgi:hypothetical protein